jgi:hypothetical protein
VLPGLTTTVTGLFVGLAVVVVLNAALSLAVARGGRGTDHVLFAFALRIVLNVALVLLATAVFGPRGADLGAAVFFMVMLSLITLLDDRFRPVQAARLAEATRVHETPSTGAATDSRPAG